MSAGLERERSEITKRLERLKGVDQAAEEMRQAIGRKDRDVADVSREQFVAGGGRAAGGLWC